jgi:hypothetical protein
MKYIMVTDWRGHWDKVGGQSSYSYSMLRGAILDPARIVDPSQAVFIKLDKTTRLPQKCWEGEVFGIVRRTEKVWFKFRLNREIQCPQKYVGYPDGWYGEAGDMGLWSRKRCLSVEWSAMPEVARRPETAIQRQGKERGVIVAFSFGKGAHEEVARAKNEMNIDIKLKTVEEILKET